MQIFRSCMEIEIYAIDTIGHDVGNCHFIDLEVNRKPKIEKNKNHLHKPLPD